MRTRLIYGFLGWPAMGLRFSPKADAGLYLNVLMEAAAASGGKFDVFTHDTMPLRYHFTHHERIAPIYVVPRIGYVLTDRIENGTGLNKGVSTYCIRCYWHVIEICNLEPRLRQRGNLHACNVRCSRPVLLCCQSHPTERR